MTPRTSLTDPLRIDPLPVGAQGGLLGLTFCPGKFAPSFDGPRWARDLDLDLDVIQQWGAQVVLTLIEDHEFIEFRVQGLGAGVKRRGIDWHHLPITDKCLPDARFESRWAKVGMDICDKLLQGGRVVVHCRGGLGRAGTVAARILVDTGTPPREAITRVRAARQDTIEVGQDKYVLGLQTPAARAPLPRRPA